MKKKLSIITVTYNCEELVEKTILSILSQNFDGVELIIIDGNSTDKTTSVIKKYLKNISYFSSSPDFGIYDAMNKGIKIATGEWLLFLNAGDILNDDYKLVNINWNWPVATEFVIFSFCIENQQNLVLANINVQFGMPTSHQAMFIKTDVMKNNNFKIKYKVAADYELFVSRFIKNKATVFVDFGVLTTVLPDGYSKANILIMQKEYLNIILKNLGAIKAIQYFICIRPNLFAFMKKLIPANLFRKMKQ